MAEFIRDYDDEDLTPDGRVTVEWSVDLTEDIPEPEHDLVARYGRDGDGRVLVQLFEERPHHSFPTNPFPVEVLSRHPLPRAFVEFLNQRKIDPEMIAELISRHAAPPVA